MRGRATAGIFRRLLLLVAVVFAVTMLLAMGHRPRRAINPPLAPRQGTNEQRFEGLERSRGEHEDLVVLAFSGGGSRAAAFAYGVLEALRGIEIPTRNGGKTRLLDEVDVITGISGGSFTALAYGLYGERLFDFFESGFLKRDVQGALVRRILNPMNWPGLWSAAWGRSELAAQLYDEILFHGATFDDLERAGGPVIAVGATELTSGARIVFLPQNFDVMCADLGSMKLSRAAAASSAVPVVLSPVTINNYGGTCGYRQPQWLRAFAEQSNPPRPAGRMLRRLEELEQLDDASEDRYFHLVDGAVSDNLGLRGVLDYLEAFEALRLAGTPTPLDHVRRVIIFVVNSASTPSFDWNATEESPGALSILVKAAGVPVDRYANESIELLRDIDARWSAQRAVRDSVAFDKNRDPQLAWVTNAPNADIHTIEVSFRMLSDKKERDYFNQLPTSFALPADAVDRLRAAARRIILESPDFQQILKPATAQAATP
ncbi:MAG: patatin-like phospholipase family protein [Gammaproteobacteria bacterium]|nr:patatin-like phospholipase family protein [Gammaproteobacteria bacterium]MBV9726455.1 patatin-like phospholipase family protein [Gammaproteobacteria bacterium]